MKNKSLIDYVNEYCENNEALNDVYRGYIYGFLAAATDHQEYQELDNPFIKLCIFEKVRSEERRVGKEC